MLLDKQRPQPTNEAPVLFPYKVAQSIESVANEAISRKISSIGATSRVYDQAI